MVDLIPDALRFAARYAATRPGCVVRTPINSVLVSLSPVQAMALAERLTQRNARKEPRL
jgi:hypothetical protein